MKKLRLINLFFFLMFFSVFSCNFAHPIPSISPGGLIPYRISGPYSYNNLSVYLIHGKDKLKGHVVMTLEEALAKKQVIVHETSDVNQLAIENLGSAVVFIQSGDIVRGGKQDRAMQYDMLLPPKSGRVSLPSFCVEQGRWQQRAAESTEHFSSSANALVGKKLKLAAKQAGSQESVWNNVHGYQLKLSNMLKASVQDERSRSSLELTLEQPKVKQAVADYISNLSKIISGKNDVIGYAFAVNGKINSADTYASNMLFRKLWPKLLKTSAAEAAAEQESKSFQPPHVNAISDFLADAENKAKRQKETQKVKTKESVMTEQENARSWLYETRWRAAAKPVVLQDDIGSDTAIHTNYIAK